MFTNTSAPSHHANSADPGSELDSTNALSRSSLQSTRDAIARWTKGSVNPVRPAGQKHVSAQERWFAQTQRDLAAWICEGGFAQRCDPAAAAPAATGMLVPQLYKLPGVLRISGTQESADACVD